MRFFALGETKILGQAVSHASGISLDLHEERDFAGGEHKSRPLVSVRGSDVYVLHSLAGRDRCSANDKLCKLLFFIAACRENGAARITAVVPYLAYSRKDRQTKARDPVTTRYVAQLFEAVGTDTVVTLDVHNIAAFQNAFRCRSVHLDSRQLFAGVMMQKAAGRPVVVFSPDGGGIKRAQLLRETLESVSGTAIGFGFAEKRRSRGVVSGSLFAGDVDNSAVFIVDDMISTGGTMTRSAQACRERGAAVVYAIATHGLFDPGVETMFADPAIDGTIVTDSVAPFSVPQETLNASVEVVSVAPLIGEAIKRLHSGGSISELLRVED